jgi:hypothetical protein
MQECTQKPDAAAASLRQRENFPLAIPDPPGKLPGRDCE